MSPPSSATSVMVRAVPPRAEQAGPGAAPTDCGPTATAPASTRITDSPSAGAVHATQGQRDGHPFDFTVVILMHRAAAHHADVGGGAADIDGQQLDQAVVSRQRAPSMPPRKNFAELCTY